MSDIAGRALDAIDEASDRLIRLSEGLHGDPELSFQEHRGAEAVASLLESEGFVVTRGVAGIPTAFSATAGSGPLTLAVLAEYDALPDIGHACGHNLIAAAAVGAGLGLKAVADELGVTIRVLGTPAEEAGGGKVIMLERGAFDGVHAAMMIHPWSYDRLESACLAVDQFEVTFTGKTSHASAAPWEGVNAGDAMTLAQVALGLLRQQLSPGDQVHGVITVGGEAANIIPGLVTGKFMCRSVTREGLAILRPRVDRCFEAGALATGCTVTVEEMGPAYSHMEQDPELLTRFRGHAEARGRRFDLDDEDAPKPTYSTDMANISLAIPSIHPLIGVEAHGAVNHQPAFTAACIGPSANRALLDGAATMALTGIDAATDEALRSRLLAG